MRIALLINKLNFHLDLDTHIGKNLHLNFIRVLKGNLKVSISPCTNIDDYFSFEVQNIFHLLTNFTFFSKKEKVVSQIKNQISNTSNLQYCSQLQ